MDEDQALTAFTAISNQTRLRSVRLLVVAGTDGRCAGAIARALGGAPASRISFHLSLREQSGLVGSPREERSIIYSAVFSALSEPTELLPARVAERRNRMNSDSHPSSDTK